MSGELDIGKSLTNGIVEVLTEEIEIHSARRFNQQTPLAQAKLSVAGTEPKLEAILSYPLDHCKTQRGQNFDVFRDHRLTLSAS